MKKIVASLFLSLGMILVPAIALAANENPLNEICKKNQAENSFVCNQTPKDPSAPDGIIVKVTNLIALIGGIAAVIIIMVGGFSYIMASGDSGKINKAKDMIIFALVGLAVIIFARTIIVFVMSKL